MALILASTSPIRRQLLGQAGVDFEAVAPGVDESAPKAEHREAAALTAILSKAKALAVSSERPGDWVIGSDSALGVDGRLFGKPASRAQAAEHLRYFSGRTMVLTSAAALASDGEVKWSHVDSAMLKVRPLSERFINAYLDAEWPEVAYCVGVFRLEGRGVQLFDSIDGDYFTVLGMPLLPLVAALRERGLVDS